MFGFKQEVFDAEQMTRDTPAELPHIQVLVPAGDWLIYELDEAGNHKRPVLYLTNARFRELMEPIDKAGEAKIAAAAPVYIPQPSPPNPDAPRQPHDARGGIPQQ
jgi:hypothetical protein